MNIPFRCLLIIVFYFLLRPTAFSQTGVYIPELAPFDAAMENLMTTYNVPGSALAITYQGRLVYNRGFGFADTTTQEPVLPNSLFRIASVSKPITSLACMKLYEQGLLNLDARVFGTTGILNDAIYQNILDDRDTLITVRMLLQHSAGWNSSVSGDPMFDVYNIGLVMGTTPPLSTSTIIQYVLANKSLDFTPGTQYQYSNFGFCVLGRVIEKITGQVYKEYVSNSILLPLGISDMQLGNNLVEFQYPNEVTYYDYPGAPLANYVYASTISPVPWPYGGFSIECMDSHGGWIANCEDLLKMVCAFDGYTTRPDFLSSSTISTMTQPSINNTNYACGLAVNSYNNWWHMGSLPGTTSEIVRNGNGQLNWAILLNTRDAIGNINAAVDNLVWSVLPSITSWPSLDLFSNSIQNVSFANKSNICVEIYPNPAKSDVKINCNSLSGEINIKAFDALGVMKHKETFISSENPLSIDLSKLTDGVYFIHITNHDSMFVKKIILKKNY